VRDATRRHALAGAAALLLVAPGEAAAQPSDAEQLERLLALELRLESVYRTALARGAIERELGETLLEHEREHARGLEQALRGRRGADPRAGVPPPRLGPALASRPAFARFAIGLEAETVRAYQDVLTTLRNDRLLQPLGSIMASGAQHVVALRGAVGAELIPLA
jgi:rubrerythrin